MWEKLALRVDQSSGIRSAGLIARFVDVLGKLLEDQRAVGVVDPHTSTDPNQIRRFVMDLRIGNSPVGTSLLRRQAS